MTDLEYEELEGTRVTTLVKFAISDLYKLMSDHRQPSAPSSQMMMGSVVHALLLREEHFTDDHPDVCILDYDNYMKKEAREAKEKAILDNKLYILRKEYEAVIKNMPLCLHKMLRENNPLFEHGLNSDLAGIGLIKGKIDCLQDEEVIDLKVTTQNLDLDKQIFNSGYQLQLFLYMLLSGRENGKIIFYNYETGLYRIKNFNIDNIRDECIALIEKAFKRMEKYDAIIASNVSCVSESDYITPQWAYQHMMETEY